MTAPYHRLLNRWRAQTLDLPPRPLWREQSQRFGKTVVKLYGYSRHLVPTPPDWDDSAQVTGFWFLDQSADWQPPADLPEFLAASPKAVLVGFGSISGRDPERTTEVILQALRLSGQRGVLVGGWGGLCAAKASDTMRFLESVPYDWLLPRVAAVVHHGGAGSTAAGLRAGKPTVVCPFFGDQPFWGRRVYELGVGPHPIPQKRLSASALAEAIHNAVTDENMRCRAVAIGEKIRSENGVQRAVEIVNDVLHRWSCEAVNSALKGRVQK